MSTITTLLCAFCFLQVVLAFDGIYSSGHLRDDQCGLKVTGIDGILSQRTNYGWGLQTARGVIAVFTGIYENKTHVSKAEKELMKSQLEVQLAITILRNKEHFLSQRELSEFIHALLIVGSSPWNFRGIDLVRRLRDKVLDPNLIVHPYSVLCTCNAGLKDEGFLKVISKHLQVKPDESIVNIETKALTLKAFACFGNDLTTDDRMKAAASALASYQKEDGSFGNIFTTSVVVQALKPYAQHYGVVKRALSFLKLQKSSKLVDIYYIEMALRQYNFIKDYPKYPKMGELPDNRRKVMVKYTVKVGALPDTYITISMNVPTNSTVLDVMKLAEVENSAFNFKQSDSRVYAIGGLPNNAEDGFYWRLVKRMFNDNDRNSKLEELTKPVTKIFVGNNEDYIFQYLNIFSA